MNSILTGKVYSQQLGDWQVSWESEGEYRYWCYQTNERFAKNILVIMFNPGSLNGDGINIKKDITLRILREVCEGAGFNPFIVNLFDFASPSPDVLFSNWAKRDNGSLIYTKLDKIKFSVFIMAYGDYENRGVRDGEIKDRVALVQSSLSGIREVILPKNRSETPKHPRVWQLQKLKPTISRLLTESIANS